MLTRLFKPKEVVQLVTLVCFERFLGMGPRRPGLAVAEPQNEPTTIDLRHSGPVAKTEAILSLSRFPSHLSRGAEPLTSTARFLWLGGAGGVARCVFPRSMCEGAPADENCPAKA